MPADRCLADTLYDRRMTASGAEQTWQTVDRTASYRGSPRDAALRELEEEAGLVAGELIPLHTFFVNPGRSAWPVHVIARGEIVDPTLIVARATAAVRGILPALGREEGV